jgi:hypothetical protein
MALSPAEQRLENLYQRNEASLRSPRGGFYNSTRHPTDPGDGTGAPNPMEVLGQSIPDLTQPRQTPRPRPQANRPPDPAIQNADGLGSMIGQGQEVINPFDPEEEAMQAQLKAEDPNTVSVEEGQLAGEGVDALAVGQSPGGTFTNPNIDQEAFMALLATLAPLGIAAPAIPGAVGRASGMQGSAEGASPLFQWIRNLMGTGRNTSPQTSRLLEPARGGGRSLHTPQTVRGNPGPGQVGSTPGNNALSQPMNPVTRGQFR